MINFGIDLGTTNSAIAKFENGKVEIFKNPMSLKQTLPSVVAFRKSRIVVGDKAREFLEKDPQNVVGSFKRKMGTSDSYFIESIGEFKNPTDLSAHVLKELKNFVHTGESITASVITIPASFDTIQSNATKKAGFEAGFEEVVLLQEPIAASLAYANKESDQAFEEGQWLVYDLGGGTFDVALVRIQDGEMKVLDHEGDNFLGGTDFDKEIVEKIVIPFLENEGQFTELETEMKSASGKYNKLYHILLNKAEEVKIQLSHSPLVELEFECEDMNGEELDCIVPITRASFEALLAPHVDRTIQMIKDILNRNTIQANDLKFILMVGGSTYIPYVRNTVKEQLDIEVNCQIDPTTAVAVGAAFYAGTKPKKQQTIVATGTETQDLDIELKVAYQKATQDEQEYFTALIEGEITNLFYRITRQDGGYDSGLKTLESRITEYLPLVKNTHNVFDLKIFDDKNNPLKTNVHTIGISHGQYSVVGQPLPHDICLEIDDLEKSETALEVVFEKNAILPTKRTLIKEVTKTIRKNSQDGITINVVEGPAYALPSANQPIGFIRILGKDLERDLIKGSDIEITLEMSESRDLKINAYLLLTDQEFENVFNPSQREVDIKKLTEDLGILLHKLNAEIQEAEANENYEVAADLNSSKKDLRALMIQTNRLAADDVTDEKFQIEDKKRKIAQQVDSLTADKRINAVKMEYFKVKKEMLYLLEQEHASDADKANFNNITQNERSFLSSNSLLKIQEITDKMYDLKGKIRWRDPNFVMSWFYYLVDQKEKFTDPAKGEEQIKNGELAIQEQKWDKLRIIVNELYSLLPKEEKRKADFQGGTGIG